MAVPSRNRYNRVTIAKSNVGTMALTIETRKFASQNATRLLGRLAFQMNSTRKSADADAVHDLRVSIRRFHQALTVFKSSFPGKDARKIRRRMKKLMTIAGEVRNLDIALKLLAKFRNQEAASLRSKLESQRKESERVLIGVLKRRIERKSSLKWRTALEGALASGNSADSLITIEQTSHRLLPRLAADFVERGNAAAEAKVSSEKLHSFRLAAKKFRYTLELFVPLYGAALTGWIDSIKAIQTLLGDINDCATVTQILTGYKGSESIGNWLKKRERRKTDRFSRLWQQEFGDRTDVQNRIRALQHPGQIPRKPAGRAQLGASERRTTSRA
ncbi:MAG TPA: CHAD domain-containing protein [Bryobacteraceae bacterium]|nr:CHAD domain-containing protein [Bryobacteraceae bacterium]